MKRGILFLLALFYVLVTFGFSAAQESRINHPSNIGTNEHPRHIMKPDQPTLQKWVKAHENAPRATFNSWKLQRLRQAQATSTPTSINNLSLLSYSPYERNQGSCGNCWVWAGTALMEIENGYQNSVQNRLSIQHFDSCYTEDFACNGGWLSEFANWYRSWSYAVPWSNTNAFYADAHVSSSQRASSVSCGSIGTSTEYPISAISVENIPTAGAGQANAIANIKATLNEGKGVWFAFYLANGTDWTAFDNFWSYQGESAIWTPDSYCGKTYSYSSGGGHAVAIVGYNDDDADTANHYWIVLNSWGTNAYSDGTPYSGYTARPNGLFRLKMYMNYDCQLKDPGYSNFSNVEFSNINMTYAVTPATYSVSGTVSSGSGTVISGATISIGSKLATSGSDGTYTISGLAAGSYTVTVSKSGYSTLSSSITVSTANITNADFSLTAVATSYSMSGTVYSGRSALSGATVSISGKTATTNRYGQFSFSGIQSGTYTLTISKLGYTTYTNSSYPLTSNQSGLRFSLTQELYSVSGTVYRSGSGEVLSGATVRIGNKSVRTNSGGKFTFGKLTYGTYSLRISKNRYSTFTNRSFSVSDNLSGLSFYLNRARRGISVSP